MRPTVCVRQEPSRDLFAIQLFQHPLGLLLRRQQYRHENRLNPTRSPKMNLSLQLLVAYANIPARLNGAYLRLSCSITWLNGIIRGLMARAPGGLERLREKIMSENSQHIVGGSILELQRTFRL
jgi:hypothetical protein